MSWKTIFAGAAVAAGFAVPTMVSAAPLFPDAPEDHWAIDAVRTLAARGIVEGYPDGTFKGDRSATRWEVALVVARLLAKMEQEHATFATKAELAEVEKLVSALQGELEALGVRTDKLEKEVASLDLRVGELERIRFYGSLRSVVVSNDVKGDSPLIGTILQSTVDWSTGRVLNEGTGVTLLGVLGLNVDITPDLLAGIEFVSYSSYGEQSVNSFWGLSGPFASNIWTRRDGPIPGLQGESSPMTRLVLDNFWLQHSPSDTRLTGGSFHNKYVGEYVYNGAYNPSISSPRWLPMYGINVNGSIAGVDSGIKYEAFYSDNPDASLYNTDSYGGALRYEFPNERGSVTVNAVRHANERIHDGESIVGGIPLPTVQYYSDIVPLHPSNTWLATPAKGGERVAQNMVGAQAETTLGIDFDYCLNEEFKVVVDAKFACSNYDPDTTGVLFNDRATGNMYKFGLSARPIAGLDLACEYMRVEPTFDPFIVQYPQTTGIPVFSPFGGYYSEYYQMHDYLSLPNNREGFRVSADYQFNEYRTRCYAAYRRLSQVKATTPEQVYSVGNIEPLFTMMTDGETAKGNLNSLNLGFSHTFSCNLKTDLSYFRYDIRRSANLNNDMKLGENVYGLSFSYPVTEWLDMRAGYSYLDYNGHIGQVACDISQSTPNIGFDYRLSDDTVFSFDYRFIDFKDRANIECDYQANQYMLQMKMNF